MRKILILILFLQAFYSNACAKSYPYQDKLNVLYCLSLENINIGNPQLCDSIISQCNKLEILTRANKDDFNTFLIGQILVNASCHIEDIPTAITKAKQMYEEAEKKSSKEGIVLSLQALGNIYTRFGQHKEAMATFAEAEKEAQNLNNDILNSRLALQQLHTCLTLHWGEEALGYITKLENSQLIKENSNLVAQVLLYKISLSLLNQNNKEASKQLSLFKKDFPQSKNLYMLELRVLSRYYTANGDYDKAGVLIDSLLTEPNKFHNNIDYRDLLWFKARLLYLSGKYDTSCKLYETVRVLSDSINVDRYTKSIDTLRVAYHTNRLKLESASSHNKLMAQYILLVFVVITIGVGFYVLLHRKNKMLRESKAELAQLAEKSSESIHTKSIFLSNMSHDLRTPLNAIVGFSGILAGKDEVDEQTKNMCGEYIRHNSELLTKLFNDILDISALNENKMHFEFENCEVVSLCHNVVNTVISLKNSDNKIIFEPKVQNLVLFTDSVRLQQVLINLLVNATKFTQNGTIRLTLELDNEKQQAVFAVEDTGCGVPLEKQSGIFERFEKLNEKKQGAGLGLSICKLIIDRFAGKIWIAPEYTQGARFVFTHPMKIEE